MFAFSKLRPHLSTLHVADTRTMPSRSMWRSRRRWVTRNNSQALQYNIRVLFYLPMPGKASDYICIVPLPFSRMADQSRVIDYRIKPCRFLWSMRREILCFFRSCYLQNSQQFNIKIQSGSSGNDTTGTTISVCETSGKNDLSTFADLHLRESFVPSSASRI